MSTDRTGGPAFPEVSKISASCDRNNCKTVFSTGGMTLRDYFAAKSLPSVIKFWASSCEGFDLLEVQDSIADEAYAMADAMLAARVK